MTRAPVGLYSRAGFLASSSPGVFILACASAVLSSTSGFSQKNSSCSTLPHYLQTLPVVFYYRGKGVVPAVDSSHCRGATQLVCGRAVLNPWLGFIRICVLLGPQPNVVYAKIEAAL